MDGNSEFIANFESLLRQKSSKNPPILYRNTRKENTLNFKPIQTITAKDVIMNVAKQLKAIQNADCMKTGKKSVLNKNRYKKSTFVPVNMLREEELPLKKSKFDTQPVSDTQLINIVQDAEALDGPSGMTQEFDTSFCHSHTEDGGQTLQQHYKTDKNPIFPVLDITLKEPDRNSRLDHINSSPLEPNTVVNTQNVDIATENEDTVLKLDTQIENCTQLLNDCVEIENQLDVHMQDTSIHEPLSPIFCVKSKKISNTSSALVCNLESFEKFEALAQPVIEETSDPVIARKMINSQILGKELFIQADFEPTVNRVDQISPIIELSNEVLKVDKEFLNKNSLKATLESAKEDAEDTKEKGGTESEKEVFKDEILFSSDEEGDYVYKSYQDLPFTCALETSFYDHIDVLDKTMFVGFQTASNKCIQINSESFSKAKGLFVDIDEDVKKEATVTDLVKICDTNFSVDDNGNNNTEKLEVGAASDIKVEEDVLPSNNPVEIVKDCKGLKETDKFNVINENTEDLFADDDYCDMLSVHFDEKNKDKTDNVQLVKEENLAYSVPVKQDKKFEGFKTANNKIIPLSEKALERTKTIFQDIVIDENVQFKSIANNEVTNVKPKLATKIEKEEKSVFSDEEDIIFEEYNQNEHLNEITKMDDEIFQEFENEMGHEEQTDTKKEEKAPEFVSFKTANNKNIKISDAALAKTKNIFQDIDLNDKFDIKSQDTDSKPAEEMLLYPTTGLETVDNNKSNKHVELNLENVGFKTASNKNIEISRKELSKIKKIFSDIEFTDDFKLTDIPNSVIDVNDEDEAREVQTKSHHDDQLSRSNSYAGFRTASNKDIKITEQALLKTKNIFQDIHLENDKSNSRKVSIDSIKPVEKVDSKEIAFPGFKTASNEKVSISANALVKSKKVFSDIENLNTFDENENKDDETEPPFYGFEQAENDVANIETALAKSQVILEKIGYHDVLSNPSLSKVSSDVIISDHVQINQGFQAVSDKPVTVSAEAVEKAKNMFKDIDTTKTDKSISGSEANIDNKNSVSNFGDFKTASNKDVTVSMAALEKSKKIFHDIDKDDNSDIYLEKGGILKEPEFKGFITASNKNVKISKESLVKSRKLMQDIDEQKDKTQSQSADSIPTFRGFQTASNKKVKISEEALAKSRKLFQDIDKQTPIDISLNHPEKSNVFPALKSFQTANNKQVKVSKEALAKSIKIFQNIDLKAPEDMNNDSIPQFKGFQTASNKEVRISEKALAKSKKIFQDIDEKELVDITETHLGNINEVPTFKGFQTASNKKVKVSEEALANSKKMFQDIAEEKVGNKDADSIPQFKGFQTANNKQVKVSKEALARSKKIFLDVSEDTVEKSDLNIKRPSFKGFHTASNKQVQISGTALIRSRKIFENLDLDVPIVNEEFNEHSIANQNSKKIKDIGFRTGNDNKIAISKEALINSRKLFSELDNSYNKNPKMGKEIDKPELATKAGIKNHNQRHISIKEDLDVAKTTVNKDTDNIDSIINTQVLNNFEITLNTEDFLKEETPKKSKRSGSPILSCPKAKRRKVFQTPYSQKIKEEKDVQFKPPKASPSNVFKFDANYKKTKMYTLKDLENLEKESLNPDETDSYISNFKFENLLSFEYFGKRNDLDRSTITITDLKKLFLDSVNKKLVPEGWLDIHLKLIIFKLLSYELKFPKTMNFVCTARNVIEQLKYRYDKELYNAERPALRKIMEKDDIAMKTLVLCVVDVYLDKSASSTTNIPNTELLLSDGWYCIRAVTDRMLAKLVHDDKIRIGTKLVTHGAELVGSEQAVSPWEDTASIRLKLSGNSTRRAHWHARLGYHGNGAILSQLSNVAQDGGKVSKLRVYVTRVYPALYIEKFEDGSTVTRSERLETLHQMRYETDKQMQLEKIYEEVEKEIYDQDSQDSEGSVPSGSKRKCLDSGSQIAKMMKRSRDPAEFRSNLTSSQTDLLVEHTSRQRERQLQSIQNKVQDRLAKSGLNVGRNVVSLLKIRVAGVEEREDTVVVSRGMLSIWKPNDAVTEMIREGTWLEVINVMPTAVRYAEIQLSAGRQSVFSQLKYKETEKIKPYLTSLKRTCYPIKDLIRNPGMTTDYNEVDTAGIIFEIDPSIKEFDLKKHQFQNVHLTDGEMNIICVNFWGGLKKFGFDVLDTGQVVAAMNLQKRAGNSRKNIPHYRVTEFSYFTKTPKNENARKIVDELSKTFYSLDKKKFINDCINTKNNYSIKLQSNENISPYRFPNMDLNLTKNKMFLDSPLAQKSNRIDENVNLTGLDFESTFKQTDTQELSPKTLMRKKQVKEKIAKLKRYGEPPQLSPMHIINKSNMAFKSPLISKSDVSNSVASEKKILLNRENSMTDEEISCSPVICMNRTYVKRANVNPVKLNFSSNGAMNETSLSEVVDEFAEEFDGSPPLSLD